MTNLVDIPVVVSTLITFFTMGGSDAALELIKGLSVNGALKLSELKDELIGQSEVNLAVKAFQQNPIDINLKSQLEQVLHQALEQHPVFQQQTVVQVQGDIKADEGSVGAGVISGKVTIKNTFK